MFSKCCWQLKKRRVFQADGKSETREARGPSSFGTWWVIFREFGTSLEWLSQYLRMNLVGWMVAECESPWIELRILDFNQKAMEIPECVGAKTRHDLMLVRGCRLCGLVGAGSRASLARLMQMIDLWVAESWTSRVAVSGREALWRQNVQFWGFPSWFFFFFSFCLVASASPCPLPSHCVP